MSVFLAFSSYEKIVDSSRSPTFSDTFYVVCLLFALDLFPFSLLKADN